MPVRNHRRYARHSGNGDMKPIATTFRNARGGVPAWHILMDARAVINGGIMRLQTGDKITVDRWDLIIAHPPCTYLSNVATGSHSINKVPVNWINARTINRIEGMRFFIDCINADCDRIAVENPIGIMNSAYRKPDQIIDPYQFAESEDDAENYVTKKTCLWLKGLPPLMSLNGLKKPDNERLFGRHPSGKIATWEERQNKNRSVARSKTFPGIARAMAEQWG